MPIRLDDLRGALLSVDEVAELLGIKPDSVRRRIREGNIKARNVPGSHAYLILGDELIEVLMGKPATPTRRTSKPKADTDPGLPFNDAPAAPQGVPTETKPPPPSQKSGSTPPFPEFGERVTLLLDHLGMNQTEVSKATGINIGQISRMKSGKRKGSTPTLEKFCDALGVRLEWLVDGEGDMMEVKNNED